MTMQVYEKVSITKVFFVSANAVWDSREISIKTKSTFLDINFFLHLNLSLVKENIFRDYYLLFRKLKVAGLFL